MRQCILWGLALAGLAVEGCGTSSPRAVGDNGAGGAVADAGSTPDAGEPLVDAGASAPDAGASNGAGSTRWFRTALEMPIYLGLAATPAGDLVGAARDGRLDARDGDGHVLWVRPAPTPLGALSGVDVSPGPGDIVAWGRVDEALGSPFVARYAADGTSPDVTFYPGADTGWMQGAALSASDDLFVSWNVGGDVSRDAYGPAGAPSWQFGSDTFGHPGTLWAGSPLAVDLDRDAIATDLADGVVTLQGQSFGSTGAFTPVVLKLDGAGTLLWVRPLSGLAPDYDSAGFSNVGTSNAGTVVGLGTFFGSITWGGQVVMANQSPVLFTIEANGDPRWMKLVPVPAASLMALDPRGRVAVVGQVDCGGIEVLQYDLTGDLLWSRKFGPASCDQSVEANAATAVNGDIVIGGVFTGTVDFGTGPQTSQVPSQPFLLDVSP